MFKLVNLMDKIRVTPDLFRLPLEEAIRGELNKRFANRVIINVGLCIALYDILEIKESFIYQGDGSAHSTGQCPLASSGSVRSLACRPERPPPPLIRNHSALLPLRQ